MTKENSEKFSKTESPSKELISQQASLLCHELENLSNQLNYIKSMAEKFGFKKSELNIENIHNVFMQARKVLRKEAQDKTEGVED